MLALNGIFILVTQHGLEYPKFYERLYGLVTPDAFVSRNRQRFFQMADIFLASGLVPAYTCASFAKRFARLALGAPPAGALAAIAFVHNILRRHPACMQLLHRVVPPRGGSLTAATATDNTTRKDDGTHNNNSNKNNNNASSLKETRASVWSGDDVYAADEPDPAKSRALESSLWELTALRRHADPTVAAFCSVFDKDLSDRRKTAEVDMGSGLDASYASMFTREVERRLKQVPAAFYAESPQGLQFDKLVGWKE